MCKLPGWGHLFWESDCAKWLEGACYFLRSQPDQELLARVNELVDAIIAAQHEDGYLNVHFTVTAPGQRWTNVRDWHEMYNAGHLFEAAVAFRDLTDDERFARSMIRFVHHIADQFGSGEGRLPGYPGHPEIELALFKLWNQTGDDKCLELAEWFLSERGADQGRFFKDEQKRRGEDERIFPRAWPEPHSEWYQQAHLPLVEQTDVQGHAVRVTYLLTGLADLAVAGKADKAQKEALWRLWRNMMSRKASVTGGVGSEDQWEGFARLDYALPDGLDEPGGGYNETCAGLGILMLADRLQCLGLDGPGVTDLAERTLYNASVTCGMGLDGTSFTYENRLASSQGDPCRRFPYFDCSCCPPNVLRTLAIIGGYFWSPYSGTDGQKIAIHHYFSGFVSWDGLEIHMSTRYPWDGQVTLEVKGTGSVAIRIPAWSACHLETLDEKTRYATFGPGQHVFDLEVKPRLIYSHPLTGKRAIAVARGPLIYCLEDVDNSFEELAPSQGNFKDLTIDSGILELLESIETSCAAAGSKMTLLHAPAAGRRFSTPADGSGCFPELDPALGNAPTLEAEAYDLTFVPYYFRANRRPQTEGSQMRVWIQDRGAYGVRGSESALPNKTEPFAPDPIPPEVAPVLRRATRCHVM